MNKTTIRSLARLWLATILTLSACTGKSGKVGNTPVETVTEFTDTRDGKTYKTVKIGEQVWMAENLNFNISGSVCYDNLESNCNIYGRLYDWATAMALDADCNKNSCALQIAEKHQGICPKGWHIPSDAEWEELIDFAGSSSTAGKKLKAKNGWNDSGNGTDDYGFAALPGSYGDSGGGFNFAGDRGLWWSSTEIDGSRTYGRYIFYDDESADWISSKTNLFSLRCLLD